MMRHKKSAHDSQVVKFSSTDFMMLDNVPLRKDKEKTEDKCNLCEYKNKDKSKMHRHQKNIHGGLFPERELICDSCDYICSDQWKLKRHVKSVHEKNSPKCDNCNFKSKDAYKLKIHMDRHKLSTPSIVRVCQLSKNSEICEML